VKSDHLFCLYRFQSAIAEKIDSRDDRYGDFEGYSVEDIASHLVDEVDELFESKLSAEEAIDVAACCYMIWCKRQKEVGAID